MTPIRSILLTLFVSVVGYLVAWHWGVYGVISPTLDGKYGGPSGVRDVIRSRHAVCVINPDWIHGEEPAVIIRWEMAEIRTRLAVVFAVWGCVMVLISIGASRRSVSHRLD